MIQIKNRYDGTIIFTSEESKTIGEAVKAAIVAKSNLSSADLRSADLSCANLSYADLRYADLRYADLRSANLRSANLRSADLRSANLRCANLSYADLSSADLRSANLSSADLSSANLSSADLRSANLSYADLRSADLRSADLRSADLRSADLRYADLRSADLRYADLSSANLSSILNAKFQILSRQIVPQKGEFIVFKKLAGGVICKLKIMDGAKRIGGIFGRKCRAEFALVLEGEGVSIYDSTFAYKVGEIVTPKPAFEDSQTECAPGIHFYLSLEEAQNHS